MQLRNNNKNLIKVLIETLWNVKKQGSSRRIKDDQSINRNIVECKDVQVCSVCVPVICINRNIVECKDVPGSAIIRKRLGINRNIVECKDDFRYA